MRHGMGFGKTCFAVGMFGIGVMSLIHGDFALQWQPVPKWVPWREGLAYVSGVFLLVSGAGLLVKRSEARAALALTLYVLLWVLLLEVPKVADAPASVAAWSGACEIVALTGGALILFATAECTGRWSTLAFAAGDNGVRIGRVLFAVSLPVFGLAHFVYAEFTASMIPEWLPSRVGLAYFTGAAHIAAGFGLLFGIAPRLAATLEAIMMSSFVCLLHIPGVVADPSSRLQWTMLFVALSLTGAAWTVAHSLSGAPWRLARKSRAPAPV
jgi:uncharacterized membrane protein